VRQRLDSCVDNQAESCAFSLWGADPWHCPVSTHVTRVPHPSERLPPDVAWGIVTNWLFSWIWEPLPPIQKNHIFFVYVAHQNIINKHILSLIATLVFRSAFPFVSGEGKCFLIYVLAIYISSSKYLVIKFWIVRMGDNLPFFHLPHIPLEPHQRIKDKWEIL
jgi:hypothetical protein